MVKDHLEALQTYVRETQFESYDLTLTYDQILELLNQVQMDLLIQEYIELREQKSDIDDMIWCDYELINNLLKMVHKHRGTLYE